jgi:hypothetical protein
MIEDGKYTLLWGKYSGAIHVLLKKTDTENQKLQLYKHEFEHSGHKNTANISFSMDLLNGRAANVVSSTTIARDLWQVLDRKPSTRNMMKERKVKVSLGKSFELLLEKIQEETVSELVEVVTEEINTDTSTL